MPQITDKHYSDFGGLDTTTNKLKMDSKTQRQGSKNFRYDHDDRLAQRLGFQHKTASTNAFRFGVAEYKYRDLDTGESKTEILGVGSDGFLYKRRYDRLKMVRASGSVQYYSVYYNEATAVDKWTFTLYDSAMASLYSVNFDETYTLTQLATAITAAAIAGLTVSVVDEDGTSKSSSVPAYLMQTTIAEEFNTSGSDTEYNDAWYAEKITSPSSDPLFPEVLDSAITSLPDFEGLSYTNLNNCIYLTCGGYLIKYDGFTAYRAGVPSVLPPAGSGYETYSGEGVVGVTTGGGAMALGEYGYKFRYGYVDPYGIEHLGDILSNPMTGKDYITYTLTGAQNGMTIYYNAIMNATTFPAYGCVVNGAQGIADGGGTFNVDSGHNLKVGMLIQLPIANSLIGASGYSYLLSEVTAVTSTTVTVAKGSAAGTYPRSGAATLLVDNQIIQAGYRESLYYNTITDTSSGVALHHPPTICGFFLRIYRSKVNATTGTFYKLVDAPMPFAGSVYATTWIDTLADANINEEFDSSEGGPLPRAGRYIGQWQKQLVQAGRPYDTTLKDDFYPSLETASAPANGWGEDSIYGQFYKVQETGLCDFQSVYWADSLNPEAFPNSGLNEEDFQGKFSDQVRGFGENKEALFVLKDRTVGLLTGTLATGDIQKEILETDAGCSSHNSIQEVAGSLMWCDGLKGFWSCVAGRLPTPIGWKIQDDFRKNFQKARNQRLLPSRAKSTNFRLDSQYICFIPAGYIEDGEVGAASDPTSYSIMFVFDYAETEKGMRGCWYPWQDVYPNAGLLATSKDELIFSQNTTAGTRLWKQKRTATKYDMTDNKTAIEFNPKCAWLNYGMPTVDKDFICAWINSVDGGFTLTVQQYYNYMDTVKSSYNVTFPTGTDKVSVKKPAGLNTVKLSAASLGFYHNTKNELVTIDGWEVVLAMDYDPGEPTV